MIGFVGLGVVASLPSFVEPEVWLVVPGIQEGGRFGSALAPVGDLDGDGRPDLAVGAPRWDGAHVGAGRVVFVSARDGVQLFAVEGDAEQAWFGASLDAAGDVDGDGVEDLLVGAPGAARVRVISGASGADLLVVDDPEPASRFGHAVAALGDVDGDGFPDWSAGAPSSSSGASHGGRAGVYAGVGGGELFRVEGEAFDLLGRAVGGIGDVDLDGRADWLVGAPLADAAAFNGGEVRLWSPGTATLLGSWAGGGVGDQLGEDVRRAGDLDDDGSPELVWVAPGSDAGALDGGEARIVPALGGPALSTIVGVEPGTLLSCAAVLGDVDGDGVVEWAAGSPTSSATAPASGLLRIAATTPGLHARPETIEADVEDGWFGYELARIGDVTGDGRCDFAVGAPGHEDVPEATGRVWIFGSGRVAPAVPR